MQNCPGQWRPQSELERVSVEEICYGKMDVVKGEIVFVERVLVGISLAKEMTPPSLTTG